MEEVHLDLKMIYSRQLVFDSIPNRWILDQEECLFDCQEIFVFQYSLTRSILLVEYHRLDFLQYHELFLQKTIKYVSRFFH